MSYNYVQSPVKQDFDKSLQVWNFQGGTQVCNSDSEALPRPHLPEPQPPHPAPEGEGPPGDPADSSGWSRLWSPWATPGRVGCGLPGPLQAGLAVLRDRMETPVELCLEALPHFHHMLLDTQSCPNPSQQHSSGFPPATESSTYLPLRSVSGCVSWPDIGGKKVLYRQ